MAKKVLTSVSKIRSSVSSDMLRKKQAVQDILLITHFEKLSPFIALHMSINRRKELTLLWSIHLKNNKLSREILQRK